MQPISLCRFAPQRAKTSGPCLRSLWSVQCLCQFAPQPAKTSGPCLRSLWSVQKCMCQFAPQRAKTSGPCLRSLWSVQKCVCQFAPQRAKTSGLCLRAVFCGPCRACEDVWPVRAFFQCVQLQRLCVPLYCGRGRTVGLINRRRRAISLSLSLARAGCKLQSCVYSTTVVK